MKVITSHYWIEARPVVTSKIVYQSGGLAKGILKWYDPIATLLQDQKAPLIHQKLLKVVVLHRVLVLSVADMIKLGKIDTTQAATTVVYLYTFDMDLLSCCKLPITVEFNEQKEPFGKGGFRNTYKATTKHPQFKGTA